MAKLCNSGGDMVVSAWPSKTSREIKDANKNILADKNFVMEIMRSDLKGIFISGQLLWVLLLSLTWAFCLRECIFMCKCVYDSESSEECGVHVQIYEVGSVYMFK